MTKQERKERSEWEFVEEAGAMEGRLRAWRRKHPQATFDEIAEQVSQERKRLMGGLLSELVEEGQVNVSDLECPGCGGRLEDKGKKRRQVLHREGEVGLSRKYYYCPECRQGIFPPRP